MQSKNKIIGVIRNSPKAEVARSNRAGRANKNNCLEQKNAGQKSPCPHASPHDLFPPRSVGEQNRDRLLPTSGTITDGKSADQLRAPDSSDLGKKKPSSHKLTERSYVTKRSASTNTDRNRPGTRQVRKRKSGGWKALKGLRWKEVELIHVLVKKAAEAGMPLNRFVSIRPTPSVLAKGDAFTKRWLCNKSKHVWQTVRGRKVIRQPSVPCLTVYEKDTGGALHCHQLVHQAQGNKALEGIGDGRVVNVKATMKDVHLGYITKQRLPLSPEFEATTNHKRKSSDPIRGVRMSLNRDAKCLLGEA